MMQKMKTTVMSLFIFGLLSSSTLAIVAPSSVSAAPASNCTSRFLTFPAWYDGLLRNNDPDCNLKNPKNVSGGVSGFIWRIALNLLQILLQVVAYLSVGFIIYGGFVYLTSAGRSDKITRGREMIQNAVIGLVISLVAVALVAYVGGQIGV